MQEGIFFSYSKNCNCFEIGLEQGAQEIKLLFEEKKIKEKLFKGKVVDFTGESVPFVRIFEITEESSEAFYVNIVSESDKYGNFNLSPSVKNEKRYIFYGLGYQPLLVKVNFQ
jgi:hypothetical protein